MVVTVVTTLEITIVMVTAMIIKMIAFWLWTVSRANNATHQYHQNCHNWLEINAEPKEVENGVQCTSDGEVGEG